MIVRLGGGVAGKGERKGRERVEERLAWTSECVVCSVANVIVEEKGARARTEACN